VAATVGEDGGRGGWWKSLLQDWNLWVVSATIMAAVEGEGQPG